jgi:hypothetical protein
LGKVNAIKAKIPPSPLLVERKTTDKYLRETIKSRDQNMSERIPRTFSRVGDIG